VNYTQVFTKIPFIIRPKSPNNSVNDDVLQNTKHKKGKVVANSIPKETNLTEERSKIATSVMLLSQKHYCTEHQRSCYINTRSNHLHLTPQHLSTWAASIVSFASRGAVTHSRNISRM
jgi:hypothetical protein